MKTKTITLVIVEDPGQRLHYKCWYLNDVRTKLIPTKTSDEYPMEYYHAHEDWRKAFCNT